MVEIPMVKLYTRHERNVTIALPSKSQPGTRRTLPYSIGAWTEAGVVIDEAQLVRVGWLSNGVAYSRAKTYYEEPYIYGGFVFKHYGHFLVETLSRMWALKESLKKIIWLTDSTFKGFSRYQREILDLLGIASSRHHFLDQPALFADLEVPTAGAVLPVVYHPEQAGSLSVFPFVKPKSGRYVWLSRSRLNDIKAKAVNEDIFEDTLLSTGWNILHPQEMSVKEQLHELCDAELVAGFDGSAFHTLLLGSDIQSKLIIIPRGTSKHISPMFRAISLAKEIDQFILSFDMEKVCGDGRGSFKSKIISIDDSGSQLLDLCDKLLSR